jgi:hypothetical protein
MFMATADSSAGQLVCAGANHCWSMALLAHLRSGRTRTDESRFGVFSPVLVLARHGAAALWRHARVTHPAGCLETLLASRGHRMIKESAVTEMSFDELRLKPGEMRRAVERGEQVQVTWYRKPHVTCVSTDLWRQLLELAGDEGRRLLEQSRGAAA